MTVIFAAPCPDCGRDVRWTQTGEGGPVVPDDFRVECPCRTD